MADPFLFINEERRRTKTISVVVRAVKKGMRNAVIFDLTKVSRPPSIESCIGHLEWNSATESDSVGIAASYQKHPMYGCRTVSGLLFFLSFKCSALNDECVDQLQVEFPFRKVSVAVGCHLQLPSAMFLLTILDSELNC